METQWWRKELSDKQMCTISRVCLRWHTLKNCTHAHTRADLLCAHSSGGRSRPPRWPGSKWLLSSWSRVCLRQITWAELFTDRNSACCGQRWQYWQRPWPTCVVGECSAILVKDEPAFLPGLDLPTHLDKKAPAGFIGDGQMEAGVWVVTSCLYVAVKVKVVPPHWEVAAQHPGLWQSKRRIKTPTCHKTP